jgi:dTDP-4-dehydrorhamnose reductase
VLKAPEQRDELLDPGSRAVPELRSGLRRAMTYAHLQDAGRGLAQPIVLLGYEGMLGWAWHGLLETSHYRWSIAGLPEIDVTDHGNLRRLFERRPGSIINCVAWTDVDGAESNEAACMAVNATAVGRLAELCRQHGTTLVNYSTDYVFDGRAREPYPPSAPRAPMGVYARSKAAGEEALEASGCRYLNVRTSWMYAPWGRNFVRTIAKLARERPSFRVVNDQRGRPTSAEHLARATLALLGAGARGHWHITDGGECTWFEFAREIAVLTGASAAIEPCTTAEFPRPARRPAYSVLDTGETERVLGPMPDWRENLAVMVTRLEH